MPELSIVDSQPLPDTSPPPAFRAPRGSVSDMVTAAADKYGVPQPLAHAVAQMESGYNPRARSGVGAMGVMQLMPATAQSLGVKNPWDAEQNVDGGVKYLAQLSRQFDGDPQLTLAAYNAGPGAVNKYNGVPPYRETQNYVAKGTRLMEANAPQTTTTGTASRSADTAPPAWREVSADQPAPAQPDTSAGGDDIMSRIMRGEQVQVTPSDILRIAFGPTGAEQAPTLSVAKIEPLSIAKSEPLPAAPPPPPQQPPALERAWNAFTGSSGLQTLGGLSSAFPALAGRISGMPDYANEQRFKNTVSGLYQGIVGEPARISSELQKSGEALLKGDINAAADHIWFAIPYLGAVGAQMKEYLDRGDVAGALGHAAGALGTAAIATPEGRAAVAEAPGAAVNAVAEAAPVVGTAVKGAAKGAAEAATEMVPLRKFGINISVPKPIVTGTAGGTVAGAFGVPHPVGAVIGAAAPIIKGAFKGAREALAGGAPEAEAAAAAPEVATAAAPEAAAAVTPGQAYAAAQGVDWGSLSATDRQTMEQIAQAHANVAAQVPPVTPPRPQPAPVAPEPPVTPPVAESFKPGDTVQWRSQGVDQFTEPRAIRGFSPDGKYAFVEGTNTGLPVEQLMRAEAPPTPPAAPSAGGAASRPGISTFIRDVTPTRLTKLEDIGPPPATPPVPAPAAPPVAPEPAAPPASASSAAQALYDELRRSGTLEPEPAPAEKPAFEQKARDAKVDKLYNLIVGKQVPQSWVQRFTPESWRILAHEVGVPEPSAATIRQLKARLADYYRPRTLPATTPAEAQAAFDAARARVQ